jgi:hypothetical protein
MAAMGLEADIMAAVTLEAADTAAVALAAILEWGIMRAVSRAADIGRMRACISCLR